MKKTQTCNSDIEFVVWCFLQLWKTFFSNHINPLAFLVMFQNPSLVINLCLHKGVLVVPFLLSLFAFFSLPIANHTSNWWLSCQIQYINSLAQFFSCSLLSVCFHVSIFNWDTDRNIIHYWVVYIMHVTYFFFPFTRLPIFKKKKMTKKIIFLAKYLIDFKVNYMKENLSGLAGFWKYFAVSFIC